MPSRVGPSRTLLLKMTPGSRSEAAALAAGSGRGAAGVLVIRDSARQDQISLRGRWLDLRQPEDCARFAASLPTGEEQRRGVAELLGRASAGSRDELAQLARLLARAEAGKLRLERVVLSGHYAAAGMRGELAGRSQNGTLDFRALAGLLLLFPAAARQVRHLMLAICFRAGTPSPASLDGRRGVLESYRELFPELRTVTGYRGRAHLSGQGAEADLRRWARASRSPTVRREQVFGSCPARPAAGAAQRRAGGVVHAADGEQRCP